MGKSIKIIFTNGAALYWRNIATVYQYLALMTRGMFLSIYVVYFMRKCECKMEVTIR